jgi:hypothetical protein
MDGIMASATCCFFFGLLIFLVGLPNTDSRSNDPKDALNTVHAAEVSAFTETGEYKTFDDLVAEGFVEDSEATREVSVAIGDGCFVAMTASGSRLMYSTSRVAAPMTVEDGQSVNSGWCLDDGAKPTP